MRTQQFRIRSGKDLGRTLREVRHNLGLTQAEMIERIDAPYDRTRLARMEAGEGLQSFTRTIEVLRALGVEVTATMTFADDMTIPGEP